MSLKALLESDRILLFKHLATGEVVETINMCYALYPNIYKFMGYKDEQ